jgi:hypothetical protein
MCHRLLCGIDGCVEISWLWPVTLVANSGAEIANAKTMAARMVFMIPPAEAVSRALSLWLMLCTLCQPLRARDSSKSTGTWTINR